jgi:hypothetical protein
MGAAHIFFCTLHDDSFFFLFHDDEIILPSSSLNKWLGHQWRDRSMGAAHIFLLIEQWLFFWHADEIIMASLSLNKWLVDREIDQWERPIFFCSYMVILFFLSLLFTMDGSVTHFFLLCILRCIIALLLMYLIIGETQTTICTSYGCKICSE